MDSEISLPFRVNDKGGIATTSDAAERGRAHLLTYLATQPTERVMRPEWGSSLQSSVFDILDPLRSQLVVTAMEGRLRRDVPDIVLRQITASEDEDEAALLIDISYALALGVDSGAPLSTTLTIGGTGVPADPDPQPVPVGRNLVVRWAVEEPVQIIIVPPGDNT